MKKAIKFKKQGLEIQDVVFCSMVGFIPYDGKYFTKKEIEIILQNIEKAGKEGYIYLKHGMLQYNINCPIKIRDMCQLACDLVSQNMNEIREFLEKKDTWFRWKYRKHYKELGLGVLFRFF